MAKQELQNTDSFDEMKRRALEDYESENSDDAVVPEDDEDDEENAEEEDGGENEEAIEEEVVEEIEEEEKEVVKAEKETKKETKKEKKARTKKELNEKEIKETIEKYTDDEDLKEDKFGHVSLRTIIGGDIFQSRFFLKQIAFIFFVVILLLLYTGNRYASQQDIITIDSLELQLQEERYKVLTQSSELTNATRQSKVEEQLLEMGDTSLFSSHTPPYEIKREEIKRKEMENK